jgi:hypothetical protein
MAVAVDVIDIASNETLLRDLIIDSMFLKRLSYKNKCIVIPHTRPYRHSSQRHPRAMFWRWLIFNPIRSS